MLLYKRNTLLIIISSLIVVTSVSAAPTKSDYNRCLSKFTAPHTSEVLPFYASETNEISESSKSRLAAIGAEILKPPAEFTHLQPTGTKTLPPVPATLFMVLTGFLCVSFFKDRKVWLGALAGLLWAGQVGIQVIPQVAINISKKHIHSKFSANTAFLHLFEDCYRLRSDVEGTKYIGLLNHLAGIPDKTHSLPLSIFLSSLQDMQHSTLRVASKNLLSINPTIPQFAIIHFSSGITQTMNSLAPRVEQDIYFSPGFIFENLPRGPPKTVFM